MPDAPDPVRDAFAPLRQPTGATDAEVARVRAAAARSDRPRRRLALGVGTAATVVAASAVAITLVDRGTPGTFVGEAGARELLHAAAEAARDDPAPHGWRLTTTTRVNRQPLEGRRCRTCRLERAVIETTDTEYLWNGPGGEVYVARESRTPRALENDPFLRAVGALTPRSKGIAYPAEHVAAAAPGKPDVAVGAQPGTIAVPEAVPTDPGPLVRWLAERQREQVRSGPPQAPFTRGFVSRSASPASRISSGLLDLTTAPELSGAQRAAAFEALADRPNVTAVPPPAAFASPRRVAVRVAAGPEAERLPFPVPDRIIVFDRATHRLVAEEAQPTGDPRAVWPAVAGRRHTALRLSAGGGGETRYGTPVNVASPGLGADGHRILDRDEVLTVRRDGSVRFGDRDKLVRRAKEAIRRAKASADAG